MKVSIIEGCPGLGDRIKQSRGDIPITDVAREAKMSPSQWGRIERGEVKCLPFETLERMAIALCIDVDKLMKGDRA